jgi:hypothetical protein
MRGQKPRNDARISNHFAASCLIAQVIANESAEFILQEAVNRARRRHGARLAIYKLISAPVLRIRFEELVDGHPNRNFRRHNDVVSIPRTVPQNTSCR